MTLTDEILRDHFRWAPIFPGSLLIEAMAQLAGALIEETSAQLGRPRELALLAGVERARFLRGVHPGECMELSARFLSKRELMPVLCAEVRTAGELAAEAELKFVINRDAHDELIAERRRVRALWLTGSGYGAGSSSADGGGRS